MPQHHPNKSIKICKPLTWGGNEFLIGTVLQLYVQEH